MKNFSVREGQEEVVNNYLSLLGSNRDEMNDALLNIKNDYLRLALEGNCNSRQVLENLDTLNVLIKSFEW